MPRQDQWIERWKVDSHSSDKTYTVALHRDGHFGCSCPRWKFAKAPKPDCKHILEIKAERVPDAETWLALEPEPEVEIVNASEIAATPGQRFIPILEPEPAVKSRASFLEV